MYILQVIIHAKFVMTKKHKINYIFRSYYTTLSSRFKNLNFFKNEKKINILKN